MDQKEMMRKIGEWIKPRFSKYEMILLLASAIGIVMKLVNIYGANMLIMVALSLLGILYYFNAFSTFDEEMPVNAMDYFIKYLSFWGLSIVVLGILFFILRLVGYESMLLIGSIILGGSALFSLSKVLKDNEFSEYYKSMVIRFVCYLVICIFLQLTPKEQVRKIFHLSDIKTERAN